MLLLNLEAMSGDSIESTANEMCAVANRLHIATQVTFNGVNIVARCGADSKIVVKRYNEEIRSDSKVKVVVVNANDR